MSQKHPLSSNDNWHFAQCPVGIRAPIMFIPTKGNSSKKIITSQSTCREGVVHGVRRSLQVAMTNQKRDPYYGDWSNPRKVEVYGVADLDAEDLKQPGESFLHVSNGHITNNLRRPHPKAGQKIKRSSGCYWGPRVHPQWQYYVGRMSQSKVRDFLAFCDAIIGPITVLLNPDRYEGNWWETSYEEATAVQGQMRWYGIDNTAIAHPALTSLYTGLARQCAFLVRTELRDEILGDSDRMELRRCLTQSDPELALRLVNKMRRWVAVPAPRHGTVSNVPVPHGSFPKILTLHKALYAHGFEKTFGKSFDKGWALRTGPYGYSSARGERRYSGIHTFMGTKAQNPEGKRIKELAQKKRAA